ncbi:LIM domain-containing protein 2 isoform X1 [Sphaerodactylus townsendi]|uniref:LIM domain-containing protein 2 isoform X1 n=1 Tax=Sphaerodactylus townsendi TaxID=933632 RepID=UPI0020263307|nr:LIM domain-containing protein 2 isoform X1 [Sphaerodactylus townsendi]
MHGPGSVCRGRAGGLWAVFLLAGTSPPPPPPASQPATLWPPQGRAGVCGRRGGRPGAAPERQPITGGQRCALCIQRQDEAAPPAPQPGPPPPPPRSSAETEAEEETPDSEPARNRGAGLGKWKMESGQDTSKKGVERSSGIHTNTRLTEPTE